MTISEWEKKLREKERELLADIARTEADARATAITEPRTARLRLRAKKACYRKRPRSGIFSLRFATVCSASGSALLENV